MSGKLTAEQVRKTVEKHWHDLPAEYDMPEATALPEYSYDWQAIADELNSRAERTCENVGYYIDSTRFKCSECGYNGWTKWAEDGEDKIPSYCPNCGAKVVGE